MAQRQEVQYVRYYSAGSEAKILERRQTVKPKFQKSVAPTEVQVHYIDPVATLGTVVAIALLICMLIGVYQLAAANHQIMEVEAHISSLKAENEKLNIDYRHSYDRKEVENAALSMGMIPRNQAKRITVTIPEPEVIEQPSWYELLIADIQELFA